MNPLELPSHSMSFNHFIGVIRLRKADLKIIMANLRACELLGEDSITEKTFDAFLYEKERLGDFLELVRRESAVDHEFQLIRSDGDMRWVTLNHSLYRGEEYAEIILLDKTADKLKIEELEKKNTLLDQFIAHASHDLRTPIGSLQGLLHLSKKESQSVAALHEYIDMMSQRVQHLDTMLNDLTSIALNQKSELTFESVKIEEEINTILANHYIKNQVHVILDIKQHDQFFTDVRRLRIILRNLISNSIKYQKPTSRYPFIRITILVERSRAQIEIADNGIGIPAQHDEKIYSMFYRATDKSSGSGLGLYIVKSMMDKLQGTIGHTSSPEGSVFKVEIPISHQNPGAEEYISLYASTWLKPGNNLTTPE